ncbi:MAG: family 16 glycosylhydrolase [Candidatus Aureabacteria bacterium]|nr:family 16 glycosylhydrolase [Candidatus Auribacterota bacterium]
MQKSKFFIFQRLTLILLFVFFSSLTSLSSASEKKPAELSGWILVWEDEFEGDALDDTKWRVEDAALVKNNELQYYSPDEVYLKNGVLVLRSRRRQKGKRLYTSGLVETKGKFTQVYGRFEIRAKLPRGKGLWPAHWLMNAGGTWPPEIDIMEMVGHEPNTVHMTNHYGIYPKNRLEGGPCSGPDFSEDFHTFALEWEEKEMRWYVDGVERFSTKRNIPNIPFYLVLNTAVGGDWPGFPDATTSFPQHHEIDYVRVYKRDIKGTCLLALSADNGRIIADPDEARYPTGAHVKLQAVPKIGFKFSNWGGDLKGRENPAEIVLKENMSVTAQFIENPKAPKLISRGKTASASSVESNTAALGPKSVTDGKMGTRWSSQFSDPQWIVIDLGKTCVVQAVRLEWETAYGREYDIESSLDGQQWKTIRSVHDTVGGTQEIWMRPVKARFVRLYGRKRATQWGYSLWEFEVFGNDNIRQK